MPKQIPKPVKFTVGGKEYTLSPMQLRHAHQFVEFAKEVLPSKLKHIRANKDALKELLSPEEFLAMINKARDDDFADEKLIHWQSPRVQELLNTTQGTAHLWYLLLKDNHPMTEQEAMDLMIEGVEEQGDFISAALREAFGSLPTDGKKNDILIT